MMGNSETLGNWFNQPIHEGANVFDVNGEKVGSVSGFDAQGEYLTLQKGWLFTHDIYVPSNNIGRVTSGEVYLNLSKDDLKDQRWETPPESRPAGRITPAMGLAGAAPPPEQGRVEPPRNEAEIERSRVESERVRREPERGRVESERVRREPERGRVERTRATAGQQEEDIRLPMRQEEFFAEKQPAETRHIRLHKRVVEEQATSSVPITREEVTIERVPLDGGSLAADENTFREQDIDIPVRREEVIGGKRVTAREEVRIHKEYITEMGEVRGTVRKEQWSVEGAEDLNLEMPHRATDEQLGSSAPL